MPSLTWQTTAWPAAGTWEGGGLEAAMALEASLLSPTVRSGESWGSLDTMGPGGTQALRALPHVSFVGMNTGMFM